MTGGNDLGNAQTVRVFHRAFLPVVRKARDTQPPPERQVTIRLTQVKPNLLAARQDITDRVITSRVVMCYFRQDASLALPTLAKVPVHNLPFQILPRETACMDFICDFLPPTRALMRAIEFHETATEAGAAV